MNSAPPTTRQKRHNSSRRQRDFLASYVVFFIYFIYLSVELFGNVSQVDRKSKSKVPTLRRVGLLSHSTSNARYVSPRSSCPPANCCTPRGSPALRPSLAPPPPHQRLRFPRPAPSDQYVHRLATIELSQNKDARMCVVSFVYVPRDV